MLDDYGGHQLDRMYYMTEILEDQREYESWLDKVEDKMNEARFKADPKMWEAEVAELDSQSGGTYVFPEPGKTKVRLLLNPEREISMFASVVIRSFQGKERQQYMMPVLAADQQGNYSNEVKYLVVAKTVYKGILELLANEWDLFHPDLGHGIVIDRTGEGLKTRYNVTPSPSPIPVDYLTLQFPGPLEDYVESLEASDREGEVEVLQDDDIPF